MAEIAATSVKVEFTLTLSYEEASYVCACLGAHSPTGIFMDAGVTQRITGVTPYDALYNGLDKHANTVLYDKLYLALKGRMS